MHRPTRSALLFVMPLALALISSCTTNTYPDGSRETVWGTPIENGNGGYQPGTIRDETGQRRRQTDLPD